MRSTVPPRCVLASHADDLVSRPPSASLAHPATTPCSPATAFLTQHLQGFVVGIDASPSMVGIAQDRLPDGLALQGDALNLPFADDSFDRVLTGHFYGHLEGEEREAFLGEAARVAPELVVVDSAQRAGKEREAWQERVLNDGSRHRVYKRYLSAADLEHELGADVIHAGTWFVVGRVKEFRTRREHANRPQ